jgi:hypothetical protein
MTTTARKDDVNNTIGDVRILLEELSDVLN